MIAPSDVTYLLLQYEQQGRLQQICPYFQGPANKHNELKSSAVTDLHSHRNQQLSILTIQYNNTITLFRCQIY